MSSSLTLDVSRMRENRDRIDRMVDPDLIPAEEDYRITAPLHLAIDIVKDKAKVRIHGGVEASLELMCSRCLEGYAVQSAPQFDLTFLPMTEAPEPGSETELAEQDTDTSFYRDGVIDLGEMVHEQLYLSLPMKPLCRDECRGLCPVCGTNQNTGACDCRPAWEDPRLAALKALVNRDDDA